MLKDQYQLLHFMEKIGTGARNVIRLLSFGRLGMAKNLSMLMVIYIDMNVANYLIWNTWIRRIKMCYITSVINNLFSMFDAGLTVKEVQENYEYYSLSMISAAHDWWEAEREEGQDG